MFDLQAVKGRVDIVDEIIRYVPSLKRAGNVWKGLCPFHQDKKTPSLVVYPDTQSWHCFGACNEGGDVITFVMKAEGVDFREAVERLGGERECKPSPTRRRRQGRGEDVAPDEAWQESAWKVVEQAEATLWSEDGVRAREYLCSRGLRDDIIKDARLGYVPGHYTQWVKVAGLSVPCGIVIPHIVRPSSNGGRTVWGIKVRRSAGEVKYQQVKGSRPVLYRVDQVQAGLPVVIDEGEFNALVIAQATNRVCAMALGSASNVKVVGAWLERLLFASRVWVRMDANRAGQQAKSALLGMSERFKAVGLPGGYDDPNELWTGDKELFWEWLRGLL